MSNPNVPDSGLDQKCTPGQWLLLSAGLALGSVLILAASWGCLSLDEVLSLETALGAKHWFSFILQPTDDNNHLLNTLFLRLIGWQTNLIIYRFPAIIFGIYTLMALAFTARRWGTATSVWSIYLAGLAYPIILYCSEARGYAPAMFFAVISFELLQRCWENNTWTRLILFWLSLCLGFVAHFTFANVLVALGGWAVFHELHAKSPLRQAAINLARLFLVPAIFVIAVYAWVIRKLSILGGQLYTEWEVTGAATAHVLGLPDVPSLHIISVLSCALLISYCVWKLFRQKRPEWTWFILVLAFAPIFTTILTHPQFPTFRYFIVCFPFFHLLLAIRFAEWFRQPGIIRLLPVALILAMTTGHFFKIEKLVTLGRGGYLQAVDDMASATRGDVVRVSSDSDFKNGKLLRFYGLLLPSKKIEYIPHDEIATARPEWLVVTYFSDYPSLMAAQTVKYDLFSNYPFCGLSGLEWSVYRLDKRLMTASNSVPNTAR